VTLVTAESATMAVAAPAQAGVLVSSAKNCAEEPPSAQVFRPWLDGARYVPEPGGDAESAAGWKLERGAKMVPGQ
jgi:hypothetical protein